MRALLVTPSPPPYSLCTCQIGDRCIDSEVCIGLQCRVWREIPLSFGTTRDSGNDLTGRPTRFSVPTSGVVYKINTKAINKSPQAPGPRIISRRGGCGLGVLAEAWAPLGLVLSSGKQSWQPDLGPPTSFTGRLVTRSCSWGGGGPTFFQDEHIRSFLLHTSKVDDKTIS